MSDSEKKEHFDPDEFVWNDVNKEELMKLIEKFQSERDQELLLSTAKKILEDQIRKTHKKREADDEPNRYSFWHNLFKLPFALKSRGEGARSWLALLVTGIGIVLFWRGIWDGSTYIFSTMGSIVVGAVILIIMASLGKRQVFKIFGGE